MSKKTKTILFIVAAVLLIGGFFIGVIHDVTPDEGTDTIIEVIDTNAIDIIADSVVIDSIN